MQKHLTQIFLLLGLALFLQACIAPPDEVDLNDALTQAAATLFAELTANAPAEGDSGDTSDAASSDTPVPSEPTATPTPQNTTVTVSLDTNCRNGPGADKYIAEGALQVGEVGEVVGKPESSVPYVIINNLDGPGICWLWTEYTEIIGPLDGLQSFAIPPIPKESSIGGIVWNDRCKQLDPGDPPPGCIPKPAPGLFPANGVLDPGEVGFAGVRIELGLGTCPSSGLAHTNTNGAGNYLFDNLEAGEYCLSIDGLHPTNVNILIPGDWSHPYYGDGSAFINVTISVLPGESKTGVNFGFDWQLD